jgi:RNA polymerase sigma-70 factor (ECF subfamily)
MSTTEKKDSAKGTQCKPELRSPVPPEILEGVMRGDEVAFAEFYTGIRSALVSFITKLVGDRDEAVNIAHDALIKLWEDRDQIRQLTGYLYTVATRDSIDLLRKRGVHKRYVNEQMFVQDSESPAADQSVMYNELAQHYDNIIANMPPQRRKVLEMSRFNEMTHEEIAQSLGISYNTVKAHIHAALKDLMTPHVAVLIFFCLLR